MDRLGNVHVAQGFVMGVLATALAILVTRIAMSDIVRMVRHYLVGDTAQFLDDEEHEKGPSRAATR